MEIWDIKFDCNLSEQVKSLNSRIKELEQEVATARLVKSDVMPICYIFHMLQSQVPVEKVGEILQYTINEMSGHDLSDMPSVTTVCRIAREMGVTSDVQAGESAVLSPLTLGWDSTPNRWYAC